MFRALVASFFTLIVAGYVGSDAIGRSMQQRMPELVTRLPGADGFALSNEANYILATGLKKSVLDTIDLPQAQIDKVERLSLSAYALEPLNDTAIRNLGLVANDAGETDRALALMKASDRISRRDLAVNIFLAVTYAKAKDMDRSLAMYDNALRTSSQARELVIPAMIQQMNSTTIVDPITRLLAKRPPWADHFWAAAPRYANSLPALGEVRLTLADHGISSKPAADRELIQALAATGNVGLARRLLAKIEKPSAHSKSAVRNPDFTEAPDFLPFDWALQFDGSMATDLDTRSGVLRVSVFGEGSGQAAQQLVFMPGNAYRLDVRASDWAPEQAGQIYFKLRCADRKVFAESAPINLDRARMSVRVTRPLAGCTSNLLTIYAAPSKRSGTATVSLDRVALVPADD